MNKLARPPIISIMGHVDHGKTTLMDYIQKTQIAAKEAGGITQSIRAFHVDYKKNALTFIDTPGHEAFAKMRERGSKISDIVLLVVAADDGVKPQTKEVINLALKDNVPMVVAINKTDLPTADVMKTKTDLANNGVLLEGWGGTTVAVEISAKTGKGVEELLDMLLLVAEVEDLKVDNEKNRGIVLESYIQKNSGPESVVIIKSGTFEVGDYVLGDENYGKIRALIDDTGARIKSAGISMPVRILGLSTVLQTGEEIFVSKNKGDLEEVKKMYLKEKQEDEIHEEEQTENRSASEILDMLMTQAKQKEKKPELNIILKADFIGSLEAIISALQNSQNENVDVNIVSSGTGEVTESDVLFAKSVRAVVISFNAPISNRIKSLAQNERVIIMPYSIIYELIDDVVTAAESLIPPEMVEVFVGDAEVVDVFTLSNGTHVGGSIVKNGKLVKGYNFYVTRGKDRVFEGKITSLRHLKDEVKEVQKGTDCGVLSAPDFEFQKGDRINCVRIEKS